MFIPYSNVAALTGVQNIMQVVEVCKNALFSHNITLQFVNFLTNVKKFRFFIYLSHRPVKQEYVMLKRLLDRGTNALG